LQKINAKGGDSMKHNLFVIAMVMVLGGCSNKPPEPENFANAVHSFWKTEKAAAMSSAAPDNFYVQYMVKGNSVYVECYDRNYSFIAQKGKPQTEVFVFLDGKQVAKMNTAAFIVKNVKNGTHHLTLELRQNGKKTGIENRFSVHISSPT
jgi:hypothetical protein